MNGKTHATTHRRSEIDEARAKAYEFERRKKGTISNPTTTCQFVYVEYHMMIFDYNFQRMHEIGQKNKNDQRSKLLYTSSIGSTTSRTLLRFYRSITSPSKSSIESPRNAPSSQAANAGESSNNNQGYRD